jgi:hypothetical protein
LVAAGRCEKGWISIPQAFPQAGGGQSIEQVPQFSTLILGDLRSLYVIVRDGG